MSDDPLRGSGRTTALALQTIATALLRPGHWIPFVDHSWPYKNAEADDFRELLVGLILGASLRFVSVTQRGARLYVASHPPTPGGPPRLPPPAPPA